MHIKMTYFNMARLYVSRCFRTYGQSPDSCCSLSQKFMLLRINIVAYVYVNECKSGPHTSTMCMCYYCISTF